MWIVYLAYLFLPTHVLGQECKTWNDICKVDCPRILNLLPRLFSCQDCKQFLCNNVQVPGDICRKFTSTSCGKEVRLNCDDPRSIGEIFNCDLDDDDEDKGDVNQPRPSSVPQTATQPNISDDSNQTTVIVIAVCVSMVVVLIAVLITGVYCWRTVQNGDNDTSDMEPRTGTEQKRIRRKSRTNKRSEAADFRNKAFTNDSYRRGGEIERSRPNSTYNTINDLHIENEYRVLESQGKKCTSNNAAVIATNVMKQDKEENANANENEYNRIKFNKSVAKNSDPSYSRMDTVVTGSDYNSTCDKISTTTTPGDYQYGVPIKIKDINKLQSEHETYGVADSSVFKIENENESDFDLNRSTGDIDVYLDKSRDKMNSLEAKPRAVVTPIVKDIGLQLPISTRNKNISNQIKTSKETGEISPVGDNTSRIDDYEIAVVNEGSIPGESKKGDYNPEVPSVRITENPKNLVTDDYEIAIVHNDDIPDSKLVSDNLKPKVPTVQIIENNTDSVKDDYDIAVPQNAKVDAKKSENRNKEIIGESENDTKIINYGKNINDETTRTNNYEIAVL